MPQGPIRAIDGGGNGFRRADVYGKQVLNLKTSPRLKSVKNLLDFVCSDLPRDCRGISYAMTGDIDRNNVVVKSPNVPMLNGVPLGALTFDRSKRSVIVVNDMDGATAGMAMLLPKYSYFMGMTWSSGIGKRVWVNGGILASCEGGHIPLDPSPFAPLCGCGTRGCVESICGGEAVKRRVLAEIEVLGSKIPKTTPPTHPCRFLDDCFKGEGTQSQQAWAIGVYDIVARGMGTYLATLQTLFRLPVVVWKGTFVLNVLPLIEHKIRNYMRAKLINPEWEKEMKFDFSPEPEKDALIGAASLFEKHLAIRAR